MTATTEISSCCFPARTNNLRMNRAHTRGDNHHDHSSTHQGANMQSRPASIHKSFQSDSAGCSSIVICCTLSEQGSDHLRYAQPMADKDNMVAQSSDPICNLGLSESESGSDDDWCVITITSSKCGQTKKLLQPLLRPRSKVVERFPPQNTYHIDSVSSHTPLAPVHHSY